MRAQSADQRTASPTCQRNERITRSPAPPRRTNPGHSPQHGVGPLSSEPPAPPTSSDHAMLRWLNVAVRYHSVRHADVIVAFKTVAGPDVVDGLPALYVWEVAHCREPEGMRWAFIVWDVSGSGVRFRDCADRDEAMALYALPTEQGIAAVHGCPGVYLRRTASLS